jgi:SNF2 family DNA or RNA helicase
MGLGKTIQCIALICHLVANGVDGPFFLCAPLSTIPNWIAEFARFAPKVILSSCNFEFMQLIFSQLRYRVLVEVQRELLETM